MVGKFIIAALALLAVGGPARSQVRGFVTDSETDSPIIGALVTVQATAMRTETGRQGSFDLISASGRDLVIVAAKKGYYNNYDVVSAPASAVGIELDPVPLGDHADYEFVDPMGCAECHPEQRGQWRDSPMAQAGTNTWVYDIFSGDGTPGGAGGFVYTRDSHFAASNPQSECAACHQPERWVAAPYSALEAVDVGSPAALHGVSCDVCHKIAHIDETKLNYPGIYPGVVTLTRPDPDGDQVQYGVLGDTNYDEFPFNMRPSYQPQLTAAMCAACHQDKNDPDEDGLFEEENGVVSEPTYLEWLASPYADRNSPHYATCVDCHMPSYGETEVCQFRGYLAPERDPETVRHHRIEGTTPYFLENAVTLRLQGRLVDETLEVEVVVVNDKTGHHVPDGVTIRNMILLVEARRLEDGRELDHRGVQVVHELGGVGDPAEGYFAGRPGKLFAKVSQDAQGNGPVFFTEAVDVRWDNRIPALGEDRSFYSFALPADGGTYQVRARLIFRRAFRFLVDAKAWTEDGHGNALADVQPPHFGHLMEEEVWTSQPSTAVALEEALPAAFRLHQNHPNPFNPVTTIEYELPRDALVILKVFDLLGREVKTLVRGYRNAGRWSVVWDGTDRRGREVGPGLYFYQLRAGGQEHVRKMMLVQ